jgi:hypothetical protein
MLGGANGDGGWPALCGPSSGAWAALVGLAGIARRESIVEQAKANEREGNEEAGGCERDETAQTQSTEFQILLMAGAGCAVRARFFAPASGSLMKITLKRWYRGCCSVRVMAQRDPSEDRRKQTSVREGDERNEVSGL